MDVFRQEHESWYNLEFILQCAGQQLLSDSVVVRRNCGDKKTHNLIDGKIFYSFCRFSRSAYITFYNVGGTLTREMLSSPFKPNIHIIL